MPNADKEEAGGGLISKSNNFRKSFIDAAISHLRTHVTRIYKDPHRAAGGRDSTSARTGKLRMGDEREETADRMVQPCGVGMTF